MKPRLPSREIHGRKEEHRFSLPSILLALGWGDEWFFRKDDNDRFYPPRCWRLSAREKVWIRRSIEKIEDNVYRHSYPSSSTSLYVPCNVCKCELTTRESAYKALERRTIRSTKTFVSRPISQINIDGHGNIGDRERCPPERFN